MKTNKHSPEEDNWQRFAEEESEVDFDHDREDVMFDDYNNDHTEL